MNDFATAVSAEREHAFERSVARRVSSLVRDARRVDAKAYERVRAATCDPDVASGDAHAARVVLTVAGLRGAR